LDWLKSTESKDLSPHLSILISELRTVNLELVSAQIRGWVEAKVQKLMPDPWVEVCSMAACANGGVAEFTKGLGEGHFANSLSPYLAETCAQKSRHNSQLRNYRQSLHL